MKIIKIHTTASRAELLEMLGNNEATNKNVVFNDKRGTPVMKLTEKGKRIIITCEFVGGPTKDNGFFAGTTKFSGTVSEYENGCVISGTVLTAPIFHAFLFLLLAVSVVMCIVMKAFNVVPICLVAFDIVMHLDEFRKQGIISRYIARAVKRAQMRGGKR